MQNKESQSTEWGVGTIRSVSGSTEEVTFELDLK